MISFQNITKKYQNKTAIKDLSLNIKDNELFVLVGPSGSGKTTLLKMINRLIQPTKGKIKINQLDISSIKNVQKLRQNIGYVLQSSALFPNMNVEQNAIVQLEALKLNKQQKINRIKKLLDKVGLNSKKFIKKMPNELSGGEAQRVGIVRALASNPKIILMDEPFSALDPLSRRQLQALILKLHCELPITFIFVTHDMKEAVKLADRLAVINNGKLQQVDTPDNIINHPANNFVENFLGEEIHQNIYLRNVILAGLGKANHLEEVVDLKPSDTIFTWAQILTNHPHTKIKVENKILTSQDLIKYIATLKKEA